MAIFNGKITTFNGNIAIFNGKIAVFYGKIIIFDGKIIIFNGFFDVYRVGSPAWPAKRPETNHFVTQLRWKQWPHGILATDVGRASSVAMSWLPRTGGAPMFVG